jgi:ABC-type phosphate transport system substrate-binding protein
MDISASKTLGTLFFMLAAGSARAELVVVVNPASTVSTLSIQQVSDAFLGRAGSYRLVDLPESSLQRAEFYRKVTQKDGAQIKSIWSKLSFTGKAAPPKEVDSSAEVKKFVSENKKAIGYMDRRATDASVKVVLTVE